jgi:hypothetical protein
VKVSDGRLSRVAPVWFSGDSDHYTLFPFISRDPQGTLLLLPPAYISHDESMVAFLPAYVRARSKDSDRTWILWRGFERDANATGTDYAAAFLFDWGSHGSKWHASMFPFLWFWDDGFVAFNVYRMGNDSDGLAGAFPFLHDSWSPDGKFLWCSGYVHYEATNGSHSTALFPLFSSSLAMYSKTSSTDLELGWPLSAYHRIETTNAKGDLVRRYRRWLLFSDELADRERTFSILGIAVSHESE